MDETRIVPIPAETPYRALAFARDCLGPASEHLLGDPEALATVLGRIRSGKKLEDAVLAQVFEHVPGGGALADEFLGYFLEDLLRMERSRLSGALRRFLDSGDLAQSVMGDLWSEIVTVRFVDRSSFLSYLSRRLATKATDRVRHYRRKKRREDLRVDIAPEEARPPTEPSPLSRLGDEEERDRLILLLLRLPERDRRILTMQLRGESLASIAKAVDLSPESARKAMQRALRKARALAERSLSHRLPQVDPAGEGSA